MEERVAFHHQQIQVRCRQLQNRVASLSSKLRSLEEQNSQLRKSEAEKDEEIKELKDQLQRERERVQKMAAKLASLRTKETIDTSPARPSTAENYEACNGRGFLKAVPIRSNSMKPILRTKVTTPREDPSLLNSVSISGRKITGVGKHEMNDKCSLDRFSDALTTTRKNSELAISGLAAHPDLRGPTEIPNIIFALHNRLQKCQEDIETAMKFHFAFDDVLSQLLVEAMQCAELVDRQVKEAEQSEFSLDFLKRISKFLKMVDLLGSEAKRLKRFFDVQKVERISTLENLDMKMIDFQNSERTKTDPDQEINEIVDSFHMNLDIRKFQDVGRGTARGNNSLTFQLKSGDEQVTWNLSHIKRESDICQVSDSDGFTGLAEPSSAAKSGENTNDNVLMVQCGDTSAIEEGLLGLGT